MQMFIKYYCVKTVWDIPKIFSPAGNLKTNAQMKNWCGQRINLFLKPFFFLLMNVEMETHQLIKLTHLSGKKEFLLWGQSTTLWENEGKKINPDKNLFLLRCLEMFMETDNPGARVWRKCDVGWGWGWMHISECNSRLFSRYPLYDWIFPKRSGIVTVYLCSHTACFWIKTAESWGLGRNRG